MAEALFLVERTVPLDMNDRDGIRAVVINEDDAQTDAQIITATISAVNAALPSDADVPDDKLPAGYFDTVTNISDLVTAGALRTDGDFLCFKQEVASVRTP